MASHVVFKPYFIIKNKLLFILKVKLKEKNELVCTLCFMGLKLESERRDLGQSGEKDE